MVNIQEFLINNGNNNCYAMVKYDNHYDCVYFSKQSYKNEAWFLESPCELSFTKFNNLEDCKNCIKELVFNNENDNEFDEYINKNVIPFFINNILYEIENYQVAPYLPKMVEEINIISEKDCFEYLLKNFFKNDGNGIDK